MTSRKRKNTSAFGPEVSPQLPSNDQGSSPPSSRQSRRDRRVRASRQKRRHLLETLESRQLLAGPQLIGVQPNEGEVIVDGSVQQVAPRELTFRFDEQQVIDSDTLGGIQIRRAGDDGQLNTADDIQVQPGVVTLGENGANNEVVVRFAESLPDDLYQIDVFGFDDAGLGITGLRNEDGELFEPSDPTQQLESIQFDLRLGALIEAVVPQPVIRNADGSLTQNRNEIVIFFNEDPLFEEDEDVPAAGEVAIGGQTLRVEAEFTETTFEPVSVEFISSTAVSGVESVFDEQARSITVTFEQGATINFQTVADSISSIDSFTASIVSGSSAALFAPPADEPLRFEVVGTPTLRSVENPRFYQLLLTQDTVRTTDDALFFPERVVYDAVTNTARLLFSGDLNELDDPFDGLAGVGPGGGTFRLRVGTAVDQRVDLILPPLSLPLTSSVTSSLNIPGLLVNFSSTTTAASRSGGQVRFEDSGNGGLSVGFASGGDVVFDLGGSTGTTVADLQAVVAATALVQDEISLSFSFQGAEGIGGNLVVPASVVGSSTQSFDSAGEVLETAVDVGVFGESSNLTSLVISEAISPQPFTIELPGGNDDPGRLELPETVGNGLRQFINEAFNAAGPNSNGADVLDGITEIEYNFNGIFATSGSNALLNQISPVQIDRIREALSIFGDSIGVQFRETVNSGITFAVGDTAVGNIDELPETQVASFGVLNATLRIDPTFNDSLIVFSNETNFGTDFGESFFRSALAGIGLLLGLEETPGLPTQTLLTLSPAFINASIDAIGPDGTPPDLEPVFLGNQDILLGQFLHRPDSVDIDLFRFEVDFDDPDRLGTLTVETFAERLPDASSLDTTLTLFRETTATAVSDFDVGPSLGVQFEAVAEGAIGNNTRIEFLRSDRTGPADADVRIIQPLDNSGNPLTNTILVDVPRQSNLIPVVPIGDIIDAINNSSFASGIVTATLVVGDAGTDISDPSLPLGPIELSGGALEQITRNDDFFSEDSQIIADIGEGVYFVGVAASGNDTYDPTIPGSGFGGLSQGAYEVSIRFEPQVDEVNVIRDLDNPRANVPGTPIDGDGDGVAGGVLDFFFQTRSLNRSVEFLGDGATVNIGQTITITGGNGEVRTYEFLPFGSSAQPGNVPIFFNDGSSGVATPPQTLAFALLNAINIRQGQTGVSGTVDGNTLELSGDQSVVLSNDFAGAELFGRTIFVDQSAGTEADGSLENPFNNIANPAVPNAFGAAISGDLVRIVGNGGLDNDISTEEDNFSFQIGVTETGGGTLRDGRDLEIPQGVTTVIDAGAIFSLRNARIEVGSSNLLEDRSGSALQVLGTPRLVQLSPTGEAVSTTLIGDEEGVNGGFDDGSVIFTSTRDATADSSTPVSSAAPQPGDFGGIIFRRDVDMSAGRFDLEDEGIFLQVVNNADIRFGGGSNVLIDSVQQLVNPIQILDLRPTVSFSEISFSADAAISASPNSFEETTFQSPQFQAAGAFTSTFSRVGPDIFGNQLTNNSINGLFIRSETSPTQPSQALTVSARFDDTDVVHFIADNLVIQGTPGGSIQDGVVPDLTSTSLQEQAIGSLDAGTIDYRLTFVDVNGFESLASEPTAPITIGQETGVQLFNIAPVPTGGEYVSRNLYRLDPASGNYFLAGSLEIGQTSFLDDGSSTGAILDLTREGIRGRLDASLVVDPGTIVTFRGSRLEIGQGAQLIAEGTASLPIVFTSVADDRFGIGGTFDTDNDSGLPGGGNDPQRGDFSGIFASAGSFVSLDFATVAFAGGISLLEGGQSRGFAPLELQQADGRITNSRFEFNDDGQDGAGPAGRQGRLTVSPSTIFVRGSQPVIVGNTFIDNRGSVIDIDSDSLIAERIVDLGRQTGDVERLSALDDNFGPLIRLNRFDSIPSTDVNERQISGLEIRGGVLATETIFDDTDIAHLLFDSIEVGNINSSGGLRLLSRADESLVVLFSGPGSPFDPESGTGLTANGTLTSTPDRIGGSLQVLGQPGSPVILSSFLDDSVGAGLRPDGTLFTDINGDGIGSRPEPNDFRGILLDQFSNDRNVDVILEQTISNEVSPGLNGTVANAQVLGALAPNILSGDENRRLGFEVEGFISAPNDVDTFSFTAEAGTRVFVDIDRTTFTLDSVIEILDADGNVLVRSDDSFAEAAGTPLQDIDPFLAGNVGTLQGGPDVFADLGAGGLLEDFGSTNLRDAGLQLSLPGVRGAQSVFFLRVRSASVNPDDIDGGVTTGGYRLQLRLQEEQEFPGSVVRFADIRFANQGIHVRGLNGTSPLLGEAQENEAVAGAAASNDSIITNPVVTGQRAQFLGNLLESEDGVISVGGELSSAADIDFFQVDVLGSNVGVEQFTGVFDIDFADGFNRPDTTVVVFFDPDGETGPIPASLVFTGEGSNILDDQAQPLSGNPIDLLTGGSGGTGDPFIGPVALAEGTYFVGVIGDGGTPQALLSPTVRREPVESVIRVVDDSVRSVSPITLIVPQEGTLVGGISDGDLFTVDDGINPPVVFEFDNDGVFAPENVSVVLSADPTPVDPVDLEVFLAEIANNVAAAIQGQIDAGSLSDQVTVSVDPAVPSVVLGTPSGAVVITSGSGLSQPAETLALRVTGTDPIVDGAFFDVSNGSVATRFEFDTNGGSPNAGNVLIPIGVGAAPGQVAAAIINAIDQSGLGLDPFVSPSGNGDVFLNLTSSGSVAAPAIGLDLIGVNATDVNPDPIGNLAAPPVETSFADTANLGPGVVVTTQRTFSVGRAATSTFTGTRSFGDSLLSVQNETFFFNETFASAQDLNAGDPTFSLAGDPNIGSNISNTSTIIPHTTVLGTTVNDVVDIFSFNVSEDNSLVILDIDNGFNPLAAGSVVLPDGTPDGFVPADDPTSIDLQLQLFDAAGNLISADSLGLVTEGELGSEPNLLGLFGTSILTNDPFIQVTLPAGDYFVAVSPEETVFDPATGTFSIADEDLPASGTYQLQVSIENNPTDAFQAGDEAIQLDRSEDTAVFQSRSFDLSGYSAADLPLFYFDYLFDPAAGDTVTLQARVGQGPGQQVITLDPNLVVNNDDIFRQSVVSLSEVAGQSDIVLEFIYETNSALTGPEGLFLDDFIIGFAERGELITNAAPGEFSIAGTPTTVGGEFQLEIRPATPFTVPTADGLQLTQAFDTNARQTESATIIAPNASQLSDGDVFVINDGFSGFSFEFDVDVQFDPNASPGVTPGNLPVVIPAGSTRADVADAIRTAINLPIVQSSLEIQAADSTGSATGGFGDDQVALTGQLFGDFIELTSANDLPPEGVPLGPDTEPFRLPVLFSNGFGDQNAERAQTQVVIESNVISDVAAVGIFSEPGDRFIDPEDIVLSSNSVFADPAPLGRSTLGAVRNLPTLNNEVVGGMAPGVVIRNNTIDQAGFAGIRVAGEGRPFVIDSLVGGTNGNGDTANLEFGDLIQDGLAFVIDAGETRVVFEFDEINGVAGTIGSGQVGGDGVADGHVPIYFRQEVPASPASTRQEVFLAIFEAIQGSPLVNNGLVSLVTPTLSRSVQTREASIDSILFDTLFGPSAGNTLGVVNGAVFLEGVTSIQVSTAFIGPAVVLPNPFVFGLAPVSDAPQPVSRIINNTIFGADGNAGQFAEDADSAPNDVIADAVDTRLGSSLVGPFVDNGTLSTPSDVDLFRVNLGPGDRLVADIDTLAGGPDTVLRVFDSRGVEVAFNQNGFAPNFLETDAGNDRDDLAGPIFDLANGQAGDAFIDFTSPVGGTFFVGVSSVGNESYDPFSTAGRSAVQGQIGDFDISLEVFRPRSVVLSVDNDDNGRFVDTNTGIVAANLVGTTFTLTQIADRPESPTNRLTFEFSAGAPGQRLPNGNINVPLGVAALPSIGGEFFNADIINAIRNAVSGIPFATNPGVPNPPLLNQAFGNGPGGASGPIQPVFAESIIGQNVNGPNGGLRAFPGTRDSGADPFGFNRPQSVGIGGTSSQGGGTTETFVIINRIADIEISPEAAAAGLVLDPVPGQDVDQVLPETGISLVGGSSATVFNNVLSNLQQGIVVEASDSAGFLTLTQGDPGNLTPNPASVVVTANVFQNISNTNTQFRQNTTQPFSASGDIGLSPGPSNVNGGTDDFNITLPNNAPLFVNPEGGNFLPAEDSAIIDSAIDSLSGRDIISTIRQSIGLPLSNLLSPDADVNGVLRADNPNAAPPGGLGGQIFRDRGSNELADFVGPVAVLTTPLDNDAVGLDSDPTDTVVVLTEGVVSQFQIQLRDTGDASDPFNGLGIDDDTVVVAEIEGLRSPGANVTVFENEVLLTEGVDYSFSFDETRNIITITSLAGVFQEDRSFRIELNNQDRSVLIVPSVTTVQDGDQLQITNNSGGTLVFEFESGISLFVPEALTLQVPREGTELGGISDGDIFTIDDGTNAPVLFEFDSNGISLPDSVDVFLSSDPVPTDAAELNVFLGQIASNVAAAIQGQVDLGLLDVDVNVDLSGETPSIVIGAEAGAVAITSSSGLTQLSRTLALRASDSNVGADGGIADGDFFDISNGDTTTRFEFNTGAVFLSPTNVEIPVAIGDSPAQVAIAILNAVNANIPGANPAISSINATDVFLDLPVNGSVTTPSAGLGVIGISRTPVDGETIEVIPNNGDPSVILELNRTDEPTANGTTVDDGVALNNVAVNFNRNTTANQLAGLIATALNGFAGTVSGLPEGISVIAGGGVAVGGEQGLELVSVGQSIAISGEPSVAGPSSLNVFGQALLTLPLVGGNGIQNGSVLILSDQAGNDVVFEFQNQSLPPIATIPGSIPVEFATFDPADVVANALLTAINDFGFADITAVVTGLGQISLGQIGDDRISINGVNALGNQVGPALNNATITRGIPEDGEVITIIQGNTQVNFEFDLVPAGGGVTPGNVAVPFTAASSVGTVAEVLASAINLNLGGLNLNAVPVLDFDGNPTGAVNLNDEPGTIINLSQAPTISLSGAPGGAVPVVIEASFTVDQVANALIAAINSVDQSNVPADQVITVADRGGATLFISGAADFSGPVQNFFLPAIADLAGNPLEPNVDDLSTQFTVLLPGVGLDFGDAPDPFQGVAGRFPTLTSSNGPRNVVDNTLFLGGAPDVDSDGSPTFAADGDDLSISVSTTGSLFTSQVVDGVAQISINEAAISSFGTDQENTITIDTGVSQATLEFDLNGRFDEDNFAISPADPSSAASIASAIVAAIEESGIEPAGLSSTGGTVFVNGDDEDGVSFVSFLNPNGVLNAGTPLPITVDVTGAGTLEAFIDFNADGDFDDVGEQVLPLNNDDPGIVALRQQFFGENAFLPSNVFGADGGTRTFNIIVPPTAPQPNGPTETIARFRISRAGNAGPDGLSLSGETEDFSLVLLPGSPPNISEAQQTRVFTAIEDVPFQALDSNGGNTGDTTNDDGLLAGITDPDGQNVVVFAEDVGTFPVFAAPLGAAILDIDPNAEPAGQVTVFDDGRFTFDPATDFSGSVLFEIRVSDVNQLDPTASLVSPFPVSVQIDVQEVNDAPVATQTPVVIERTIDEDLVQIFSINDDAISINGVPQPGLIEGNFVPGPSSEANQALVIGSVFSPLGQNLSSEGGSLVLLDGGNQVQFTPSANFNGIDTFSFAVVDVPEDGSLGLEAVTFGTVTISINPVNDAPIVGDDNFATPEDVALTININGDGTNAGILDNDLAGPADEVSGPNAQQITLVEPQVLVTGQPGSQALIENGQIRYIPPVNFNGIDTFDYQVIDSEGAIGTGTVTITVGDGGGNDAPVFIGVNGLSVGSVPVDTITRLESGFQAEFEDFNLNSFFNDPEGDPITFAVTSSDPSIVSVELSDSALRLNFPPFSFGNATLFVEATDSNGGVTSVPISVVVENVPNAPELIGTLNPLNGVEDQTITADLSGVFLDRDGDSLTFPILRIGSVLNPSQADIDNDPLIDSINVVGNQLVIELEANQFGSTVIEIVASDGTSQVSDAFTLNVASVADVPIANDDEFFVPVGSRLDIIDPAFGLFFNDVDNDGDPLEVDLLTVAGEAVSDLTLNANGTFSFLSTGGQVGDQITFTYRLRDTVTGVLSNTATVTFTLNQSEFQNPLADLSQDVDADGNISPLDALLVINFVAEQVAGGSGLSIPTSSIAGAPPNFLDVDGNGFVSPQDALLVVNELAARNAASAGEGEFVSGSFGAQAPASVASTAVSSSFAAASTLNLPTRQIQAVLPSATGVSSDSPAVRGNASVLQGESSVEGAKDQVLAAGFEIGSATADAASVSLVDAPQERVSSDGVDQAISGLFTDELDDFDIESFSDIKPNGLNS